MRYCTLNPQLAAHPKGPRSWEGCSRTFPAYPAPPAVLGMRPTAFPPFDFKPGTSSAEPPPEFSSPPLSLGAFPRIGAHVTSLFRSGQPNQNPFLGINDLWSFLPLPVYLKALRLLLPPSGGLVAGGELISAPPHRCWIFLWLSQNSAQPPHSFRRSRLLLRPIPRSTLPPRRFSWISIYSLATHLSLSSSSTYHDADE